MIVTLCCSTCLWLKATLNSTVYAGLQFIAGMLGSMGVQGAVQVMHTSIPMEWTPNMGELQAHLYSELAVALGVKFAQVAYAISQPWLVRGGSRLLTPLPA